SYAAGSVSGGAAFSGGLIGFNPNNTPAANSYWDSQSTGQAVSAGGSSLTTAVLKSRALPNGVDPTAWTTSAGSYPQLAWEAHSPTPPTCESIIKGAVAIDLSGLTITGGKAQISAAFAPKKYTLSAAAAACGFWGFDWKQVVTNTPVTVYTNLD